MKKLLLYLIIVLISVSLVVSFSLVGCREEAAVEEEVAEKAAEPAEAEAKKVEPGTIGFSVPFATAPFYWAAAYGLKNCMEEMGYKVVVVNAGNDPDKQFQQLETFRTEGIQGGAIIVYDYASVSPAVDKIREEGIPFFAIDRDISTDVDCFIVTDNKKAGAMLAKWVIEQLDGEKAYIIKDYFALEVVPLVERVDGFMEYMENFYEGNYEVVGEIAGAGGGGDPFEAHTPLFKDILLDRPETNVFNLSTDLLAKPAVAACKEMDMFVPAGETGHKIIVGVDGNPETLDAIRGKEVTACFSQYPYLQGWWAGVMLDKWIQGESDLGPSHLYFGGDVITFENISEFEDLWGDKEWTELD